MLADEVAVLYYDEGLLQREIADRLGISRSWVHELLADPDGSKAAERKNRYRLPCPECGKLMTGCDGRMKSPKVCAECLPKTRTFWTRERCIAALQEFAERYGSTPTATDLNPSQARALGQAWRAERFHEGTYPFVSTLATRFGGLRAAQLAAGLPLVPCGGPRFRKVA